jgi:hypothetical protein
MPKGQIPWNKGKTGVYSEETKRRISESHKGIRPSEDSKKKMSDSRKAKFSGKNHPFFGKHHSEETKKKISDSENGKEIPESVRKKMSEGHKNPSIETRNKISAALKLRKRSEKEMQRLKRGLRWKGGISFEPYCPKFTEHFKERVRAFFGYLCIGCGSPQIRERHHVHHVNFDKNSCCNETIPLFVPLCRSCHAKTNTNREYWQNHFTELIVKYYQGKCYLSDEELIKIKGVD